MHGNENFDDDDDGEEEEEKDDDVNDDDRVLLVVVVLIKVFVKAPRWWWVHSDAPNVAFDTANKAALLLIPFLLLFFIIGDLKSPSFFKVSSFRVSSILGF